MWIRSQDKKDLFPICCGGFYPCQNHDNAKELLAITINDGSYYSLGRYNTKERALEVLNSIQGCIESYLVDSNFNLSEGNYTREIYPIYEMPIE